MDFIWPSPPNSDYDSDSDCEVDFGIHLQVLLARAKSVATINDADNLLIDLLSQSAGRSIDINDASLIIDFLTQIVQHSVQQYPGTNQTPLLRALFAIQEAGYAANTNLKLAFLLHLIGLFQNDSLERIGIQDNILCRYYAKSLDLLCDQEVKQALKRNVSRTIVTSLNLLANECLTQFPSLNNRVFNELPAVIITHFIQKKDAKSVVEGLYDLKRQLGWSFLNATKKRPYTAHLTWLISCILAKWAHRNLPNAIISGIFHLTYEPASYHLQDEFQFISPGEARIPSHFCTQTAYIAHGHFGEECIRNWPIHFPHTNTPGKTPAAALIAIIMLLFFPNENQNPNNRPATPMHFLLPLWESLLSNQPELYSLIRTAFRAVTLLYKRSLIMNLCKRGLVQLERLQTICDSEIPPPELTTQLQSAPDQRTLNHRHSRLGCKGFHASLPRFCRHAVFGILALIAVVLSVSRIMALLQPTEEINSALTYASSQMEL